MLPFISCIFAVGLVRQYLCNTASLDNDSILQRLLTVIFNRDRTFELNVNPQLQVQIDEALRVCGIFVEGLAMDNLMHFVHKQNEAHPVMLARGYKSNPYHHPSSMFLDIAWL